MANTAVTAQPQILANCRVPDGGGGYKQAQKGQYLPLVAVDGEWIELERRGLVALHNPYKTERLNPDSFNAVIYTGSKIEFPTEYGIFYRGVPRPIHKNRINFIKQKLAGNYTLIDLSEIAYVPHNVTMGDFDQEIKSVLPAKPHILVMRDEGAGDIIMSTPAIREIRRRLPGCHISYATRPVYQDILRNVRCIDEVVSIHGVDFADSEKYDLVINWCRALGCYSVPRNRGHRIDTFARHVGLGELSDKRVELHFSEYERQKARMISRGTKPGKRIGVVLRAAQWNRSWHLYYVMQLVDLLKRRMPDCTLVIIDRANMLAEYWAGASNVLNAAGRTRTFMEAAALCAECDAVVAPDTGLAHATGATGTPTVVIAGSIPPDVRYSTYPGHATLWAGESVECCPCWDWQERWTKEERAHKKRANTVRTCLYTKDLKCMDSITPGMVADKLQAVL